MHKGFHLFVATPLPVRPVTCELRSAHGLRCTRRRLALGGSHLSNAHRSNYRVRGRERSRERYDREAEQSREPRGPGHNPSGTAGPGPRSRRAPNQACGRDRGCNGARRPQPAARAKGGETWQDSGPRSRVWPANKARSSSDRQTSRTLSALPARHFRSRSGRTLLVATRASLPSRGHTAPWT